MFCFQIQIGILIIYTDPDLHMQIISDQARYWLTADPSPASHPPLFRSSQLTSMVTIGLWKPYAKTKVGESCTCSMYWPCRWLLIMDWNTWNIFLGSKYETIIKLYY
jgi:hypothetical protein